MRKAAFIAAAVLALALAACGDKPAATAAAPEYRQRHLGARHRRDQPEKFGFAVPVAFRRLGAAVGMGVVAADDVTAICARGTQGAELNLADDAAADFSAHSMSPAPSGTSAAASLRALSWGSDEIVAQPFARSSAEAEV